MELKIDEEYKRKELHDNFGGQRQGGISTPRNHPLIFIFTNNEMYDIDRILCTAHMLQNIYLKNRLKDSGLLKVFTIQCLGDQETFEDILLKKKDAFKNVKKSDTKYEKWFLKYIPK